MNISRAHKFTFQDTTSKAVAPVHRTWFRGKHTNFNPNFEKMMDANAVLDHVLEGWTPEAPIVTPNTKITAFGSCFAANISNWLAKRNYNVLSKDEDSKAYVVHCGEGMVNSFVIRQQFEWAFEGKKFEESLWHGYKAEEYGYDEEIRKATLDMFKDTDLFVLTFGLSEVWYDEVTGGVFWRSIPKDKYDPKRHKFRVTTVEENKENIREIYRLIRKHRPNAKIITTLSPIPLIATFRPQSCISANSVSKAVLRVAIDEVMRELGPEGYLHYWPSFEIVTDVFHNPMKQDRRHLPANVLDYIMMLFEDVWCVKRPTDEEMLKHWLMALSTSGLINERFAMAIKKGNTEHIERIMGRPQIARHPEAEENARAMLVQYCEDVSKSKAKARITLKKPA